MKKITSIIVQKPMGEQVLEVGAFLMNPDEKTKSDISVTKITTFFKTAMAYFSDGRVFVFKGFPFIVIKK